MVSLEDIESWTVSLTCDAPLEIMVSTRSAWYDTDGGITKFLSKLNSTIEKVRVVD